MELINKPKPEKGFGTAGNGPGSTANTESSHCCQCFVMTDPLSSANINVRYDCIDMFPVEWPTAGIEGHRSECGILLEIWRTGGLVQTSVPIPKGSWVELAPTDRAIQAHVIGCEKDDYRFLVVVPVGQNSIRQIVPANATVRRISGATARRSREGGAVQTAHLNP
jgi:hypothetical protein